MYKTINGAVFRKMFFAGGKLLEVNKATVDALNVFPVPDGDTGTNMSLTMLSAVKELLNCESNNFEDLAEALSRGVLRGARGNSGVILSQIFRGFAGVIKTQQQIDIKTFAKALKSGTEVAYAAVSKPQEGTMLTIIRALAEHASVLAKKNIEYETFLDELLKKGDEVLAKTPDMLEALKKAGVVDAGGFGLLLVFRGFLKGLLGEEIKGGEEISVAEPQQTGSEYDHVIANLDSIEDIKYAYCTEFFIVNIMKKTTLADIERLREKLMLIGDSVIAVGDLTFVKVHVHTNKPGVALQYALELGEVDSIKIENMLEQNRQIKAKMEKERKPIGMLAVCVGKGLTEIFKDLMVDRVIEGGQTMNPSADDIAQAANRINAETVLVLPNNKNIILAAEQAKGLVSNKNLIIIPTKNIPQGLAAALAFNPDASVDDNIKNMKDSIPSIKAGQVTYAVRSSNMDGLDLKEGDIIGLDSNKIVNKGNDIAAVTCDLIDKMKEDTHEIITLYFGQDVKQSDADQFVDKMREKYPDCEVDMHYGGQPVYYYIFSLE